MGDRRFEKGKCSALPRRMCARFGELPEEVIARIDAASSDQLDAMALRVLTAATLHEVLK